MTIDPLDLRCTCGHEARVHREYTTESGSGCAHWLCPGCLAYDEMEGQQMSTDFPRPIEPGEIQPGDHVRAESDRSGIRAAYEFTVTAVRDGSFVEGPSYNTFPLAGHTWTLLDRPTPPTPVVGSHWRDPETGTEYVATDSGDEPYRSYRGGDQYLHPDFTADRIIIARLEPIPAFDPAALWPNRTDGDARCGDGGLGGLTCSRTYGHDSPHAAYGPSGGLYGVWGRP